MFVIKRNNEKEEIRFDKIQKRLKDLSRDLKVDIDIICQKTIERLFDGIKTKELDEHLASITVNHSVHPHYSILAGRISISSLHKETRIDQILDSEEEKSLKLLKSSKLDDESKLIKKLKNSLFDDLEREKILSDYLSGKKVSDESLKHLVRVSRFYKTIKDLYEDGIISERVFQIVKKNRSKIEEKIDYSRDYNFEYFGYKTLEKSYLLKRYSRKVTEIDVLENGEPTGEKRLITETIGSIVERPQDLFMRVSIGIFEEDLDSAFTLYDYLSQGFYTHATPTLFNSGTKRPQLASCYLIANSNDSIDGIFDTFKEEALISKSAGGIGVWYHNVRSSGSVIKGTNGVSNGILPFLRIKNQVAKGIDQGGGKRPGSIAVYLEPWHGDVKSFINLRRKTGDHDIRARDLHLALWVPDLFWERAQKGEKWSLFDPATAPGLFDKFGKEFVELYEKYELEGRAVEVVEARELLKDIFEVLIETGEPYILNKDHANNKSNQKNLGTIKSSNLCTEIIEYSDENETAICNLASVCLPKYVKGAEFDHEKLHEVVKFITKALNKVIDVNYYVNEKTKRSNFRHRPIGIGVQGLADVFFKLKLPYTSERAMKLNKEIFETIYHAALEASMELAKKEGSYESYLENGGCPASKGLLQFDLWGVSPDSGRYNWDKLKERIIKNGLRNSLLLAPMPTASTSQIFWNTESFEPLTENLYKRKTSAGEFTIVNRYLVSHLEELGLWSKKLLEGLIKNNGSIQQLPLPEEIKEIYKTVWELPLRQQIDMAAERGYFICQSQSFNIHMDSPSMERMKDVYFYAYKKGLKTASYYFRTNPATNNQKVTISKEQTKENKPEEGDDDCIACSS
jgi:ribonucleoside-diphosphate reductase alpha chain